MNNNAKDKNIHNGHRSRMWSKYENNGFKGFKPHEVLEMMLYHLYPRIDTNEKAHKLLQHFGSLENILNADIDSLVEEGLTRRGACILTMYRTVGEYVRAESAMEDKTKLATSKDTGSYCCKHFGHNSVEHINLILLDGKSNIIYTSDISSGTHNQVYFDCEKIIKLALKYKANGAILCHNHPTGSLNPSNTDIASTNKIADLLDCINIPLIDHIICNGDRYESFAERGYLKN